MSSESYKRLLRGEITSEQYVTELKRDVDERLRLGHEQRVARALEARAAMQKHRRGKPISFSWPRRFKKEPRW